MRTLKLLIVTALCLTAVTGCKSDAERAVDKMEELSYKFINDLNNAKTKEEAINARREFRERGSFELQKIMKAGSEREAEDKLEQDWHNLEWDDVQRFQKTDKEVDKAWENAKKRFNQ